MPTLNWIGKEKVINHHQEVPFKTLKKEYTYNADESENMIIHGDNLEVLKSLLPKYEGKIDCVYIDPPYNTGEEKWVYNDNVSDPLIQKWLGDVVGREGDDLSRHDKWLCMMYPRLKLLHKLMSNISVIYVSIDDNEVTYLKNMMDEIFGNNNHLIILPRVTKKSGKDHSISFAKNHDYVVVYAKDKSSVVFQNESVDDDEYTNRDEYYEERGGYKLNQTLDYDSLWYNPAMDFELKINDKLTLVPGGDFGKHLDRHKGHHNPKDWVWRWSLDKFNFGYKNGFVVIKQGKDRIRVYTKTYSKASIAKKNNKYFVEYKDRKSNVSSLEFSENEYSNDNGKKEMTKVFGSGLFDFPKPSSLIKKLISLSTTRNSIILDAFAGSGTTGHAVLELNKEDDGNRKFIQIEMMDYAESITAERARKVISGYADVEGTGGSFSFYELGESLFDKEGNLNSNLNIDDIRKYIFYTETQQEPVDNISDFLGTLNDTGYYFNYKQDEETCLNLTYLKSIDRKFGYYVIYADTCTLSGEQLEKYHIIFKKIPRDILKY